MDGRIPTAVQRASANELDATADKVRVLCSHTGRRGFPVVNCES